MAFARLAFFPDATAAQYAALAREMGAVLPPADRLLFAAGPTSGGWQVVQLWSDRAALDAFNTAVLGPALARSGGAGFWRPGQVTDFEPVDLAVGAPPPNPSEFWGMRG